jgi:hypothetical protein
MSVKVRNKELEIEFDGSMQGFRMHAMEWDGSNWQNIDGFTWDIQRIGQTQFEALCDLASELFGCASDAEIIADQLGIPFRFSEDEDCSECDFFGNADEMATTPDGDPLCLDCAELTPA